MNITVLGKSFVGKSSLTYRFVGYYLPQDDYEITLRGNDKTSIQINGKEYTAEILDTEGEEDYQNFLDMWIAFGEGFLLVFAINDEESFEVLKSKYEKVKKGKHNTNVPIILVGNKEDLKNERKITYEAAKQLADEWGVEYIGTSAKTGFNCNESFDKLARKILEIKISVKPDKKSKCKIY